MESENKKSLGGSLQVSTEVIAKIAKLAALEINGVEEITIGNVGVKGVFSKTNIPKSVIVDIEYDVANITVYLSVKFGTKIPVTCEAVQENIKTTVQNITGIAVSKVNIVVTGVSLEQAITEE